MSHRAIQNTGPQITSQSLTHQSCPPSFYRGRPGSLHTHSSDRVMVQRNLYTKKKQNWRPICSQKHRFEFKWYFHLPLSLSCKRNEHAVATPTYSRSSNHHHHRRRHHHQEKWRAEGGRRKKREIQAGEREREGGKGGGGGGLSWWDDYSKECWQRW